MRPHPMLTNTIEAPANPSLGQLSPEWLRVSDAVRLYGLGRSSLYELISEGRIKTASLRKRNALRGTRLINRDSLAAFIDAHATPATAN
jgi:hypothetical protein